MRSVKITLLLLFSSLWHRVESWTIADTLFGLESFSIPQLSEKAQQGDPVAQLKLGYIYYHSLGVPQDQEYGLELMEKSAEQGNAKAKVTLAKTYANDQGSHFNKQEALKWMLEAAEQGDPEAQLELALWHERAAWGFKDTIVPLDRNESFKWFLKAAEQGDWIAQKNLGTYFESGYGVPQNYVQAHKWYNIAQSHAASWGAARLRDELEEKMTPEQIAEAQKLAREWVASKAGQK